MDHFKLTKRENDIRKSLAEKPKEDRGGNSDPFFFQQASGEPVFLHPLCMRMMMREYETFENMPLELESEVLSIESHAQDHSTLKKYK